jgi:hypothetical protein
MPQASQELAPLAEAPQPVLPIGSHQFQRWLNVAAMGLLLVVLVRFILYVCASILQSERLSLYQESLDG